jgi:hypothetical protein
VILFLRLIAVLNAALWFGAGLFFTFAVAPAIFTPEMKRLFGEAWVGVIAQMIIARFFVLQYWCAAIALVHQMAEWVYLGRALQRVTVGLLLGLFGLALFGGLWLQPKLKKLHQIKYGRAELYAPAQKARAAASFRVWHGVSQVTNLLALGGLGWYVWRMTNPSEGPRFVRANKFRS